MEIIGVSLTEWIGYLAMATVLLSFTMKSMVKLRLVNSLGALLFVLYGFFFESIIKTNYSYQYRYFLYQFVLLIEKDKIK